MLAGLKQNFRFLFFKNLSILYHGSQIVPFQMLCFVCKFLCIPIAVVGLTECVLFCFVFQSPSVTMKTFLQALSLVVDKQFDERRKLTDSV